MERHQKPTDRRAYLLETREDYISSLTDPFRRRTLDPRHAATVFGTENAKERAFGIAARLGLRGSAVRPVRAGLRVQQVQGAGAARPRDGRRRVTLFA